VESPTLLEFTWDNPSHCPGTVVSVSFAEDSLGRTTVRLRHHRLASAKHVAEMDGGWSWALDSLQSYVETGAPITHESWLREKGS
jgi:uncharacterized protein YndB with AHSA1/START domain